MIRLLLATLLPLLFVEPALRLYDGLPLLPDRNLIAARRDLLTIHHMNDYDPLLGWVIRANQPGETGAYGERLHSAPARRGAIVAVGDSFTWGSEVKAAESWPAALERILERPVVNGSTGAWGSDQIVLRAEQLRDVLHPRAVIVSFLDQDILRAGFRIYGGGSKPWFTLDQRITWPHADPARGDAPVDLIAHNIPVERGVQGGSVGPLRGLLGYSRVVDRLAGTVAPGWWLRDAQDVGAPNDPVSVSCALLRRLRPSLFVLQWGGDVISRGDPQPKHGSDVAACALAAGIPTLDLWRPLHGIAGLERFYVRQPDGNPWGHMSAAGNQWVAERVAEALQ